MNNELGHLKAHIIEKHVHGGVSVRVQTLTQGVIDTFSAPDMWGVLEWLEANHPESMEMNVE